MKSIQKFKIWAPVVLLLLSTFSVNAAINKEATFEEAYNIAKNENVHMTSRWKALLQASTLAKGTQISKIVDFGNSKDWYMRNASLVALDQLGNNMVYEQAQKLLTDKALVVRSAAVTVLSRRDNSEHVKRLFFREIDRPYNFNGKSSLWVRKQIMEYLVKYSDKSERDFFVKSLNDQDVEIATLSTQALEKITDIRLSGKNKSDLVKQWKTVAKNQRW